MTTLLAFKSERKLQRRRVKEEYSLYYTSTRATTSNSRRRRTHNQVFSFPPMKLREKSTELPELSRTFLISVTDRENLLLSVFKDFTSLADQSLVELLPRKKRRNERFYLEKAFCSSIQYFITKILIITLLY